MNWIAGVVAFMAGVALPNQQPTKPGQEVLVLTDPVGKEALPLMAGANYLGLGSEATRLDAWFREHRSPFTLRPSELSVQDGARTRTLVSDPMARALRRLNQWYGLLATADHPITAEQLKAGALSARSIDRIRKVFERAIARGVRMEGQWLTPEAGGEATITDELLLVEAPDARWSAVQELVLRASDPQAVASHYEARSVDLARVDTHGLLKVAVARFRLGSKGAADEVRRAVATLAQNAAPTYSHEPEEQFALIAGNEWHGRYVGRWHTHAPHYVNGAWTGGDVPSFEDMQNAVQDGQYLTLSFQPDGFDLYDASALADAGRVDLALVKVIRYRSPEWLASFRKRLPAKTKAPGPR